MQIANSLQHPQVEHCKKFIIIESCLHRRKEEDWMRLFSLKPRPTEFPLRRFFLTCTRLKN